MLVYYPKCYYSETEGRGGRYPVTTERKLRTTPEIIQIVLWHPHTC